MARRVFLESLLEPRVAALREALPSALSGEPLLVHQARVASRRLREVVPVMASLDARAARRARRVLRRVTRTLGPVREADVSTALFDEVVAAGPVHPVAEAAVRRALAAARAEGLRRLRRTWSRRRLARLETALDVVVAAGDHVDAAAVGAAAAARIAERANRARTAIESLGVLYAPERLHAIRIAVKRWRYALEIATELGESRSPGRLSELRAVQDQLGRAHDLHVLALRLRAVEARLVTRSRVAARDLRRLVRRIEASCRAIHAEFLPRRTSLVAVVRPRPVARRFRPRAAA
jgi:CHAD domain-containing protein